MNSLNLPVAACWLQFLCSGRLQPDALHERLFLLSLYVNDGRSSFPRSDPLHNRSRFPDLPTHANCLHRWVSSRFPFSNGSSRSFLNFSAHFVKTQTCLVSTMTSSSFVQIYYLASLKSSDNEFLAGKQLKFGEGCPGLYAVIQSYSPFCQLPDLTK